MKFKEQDVQIIRYSTSPSLAVKSRGTTRLVHIPTGLMVDKPLGYQNRREGIKELKRLVEKKND